MSTRSRLRPSTRNRQPSSWLIVDSASPVTIAARSRTKPKKACGPSRSAARRCAGKRVPGRVQRLPHLRRHRLAGAAGVLPGRVPARRRSSSGSSRRRPARSRTGARGAGDAVRRRHAHDRRAATGRPRPRRPTGPRGCGARRRRGCGRCRRRARRSGRSRTATRRSGSASRSPCCCLRARRRCRGRGVRPSAAAAGCAATAPSAGAGRPPRRRAACLGGPPVGGGRAASTQVSLEPPPWLELTTSAPSGSATRVRPPGSTQISSPSLTANGRRSTWRGAKLVADQRRRRRQLHRPLGDPAARVGRRPLARSVVELAAPSACGPMTMPLPPEPSTGLSTSVSSRSSTHSSTSGVVEPVGLDVVQQRLLAEVVADQVGHVRVERACRRRRRCRPRWRS